MLESNRFVLKIKTDEILCPFSVPSVWYPFFLAHSGNCYNKFTFYNFFPRLMKVDIVCSVFVF